MGVQGIWSSDWAKVHENMIRTRLISYISTYIVYIYDQRQPLSLLRGNLLCRTEIQEVKLHIFQTKIIYVFLFVIYFLIGKHLYIRETYLHIQTHVSTHVALCLWNTSQCSFIHGRICIVHFHFPSQWEFIWWYVYNRDFRSSINVSRNFSASFYILIISSYRSFAGRKFGGEDDHDEVGMIIVCMTMLTLT